MTFLQTLLLRGGPVMWPLLVCSLASLTITVERLIFWWREGWSSDPDMIDRILELTERGDYDESVAMVRGSRSSAVRVLVAGLRRRDHGLTEAMAVAASNEVDGMKRGLSVLDTIITMAPLLGILGTVIGIIDAFDLLGASGIEDPRAVTGAIAQALITTAAGLSVALITLIPFNYLISKVERGTRLLAQIATQFEVAYRTSLKRSTTDLAAGANAES